MGAVLLLGILMGMKHALEADHVAAVASLVIRSRSLPEAVRMGVAWGLGHTLTLLAVGAVVVSLDRALPEHFALMLEFAVGLMLIWLGADVLRRLARDRVHFHSHRHDEGEVVHFHAHSHRGDAAPTHARSRHEHRHVAGAAGLPVRALAIGLMHGMAGSAALILLTLGQLDTLPTALAYMALFGLGSMLGMAALSAVLALPMLHAARQLTRAQHAVSAVVGLATLGLGGWILYQVGVIQGLVAG
jgi:ABC-type nickel/cobalt efflux system permease component RcnA